MTIDWTQPVETTEDQPRPVRVLATDLPNTQFPVCVAFDGPDGTLTPRYTHDGRPDLNSIRPALRNVAPPKPEPEPVLREAWLHLYEDGCAVMYLSEPATASRLGTLIECRRIAWMSDGSPVPGEGHTNCWANYNLMTADRDEWRTQCEQWAAKAAETSALKASLEDVTRQRDDATAAIKEWRTKAEEALSLLRTANDRVEALQAEVECMTPVVDAAVLWERHFSHQAAERLVVSVRTYLSQPKKTAAEAVANVAEMMGPVKNCTTCSQAKASLVKGNCPACLDYDFWEPRHD